MKTSRSRSYLWATMDIFAAVIFVVGQIFAEGLRDVWGRSYSFLAGWISGAFINAAFFEYRAWRRSA